MKINTRILTCKGKNLKEADIKDKNKYAVVPYWGFCLITVFVFVGAFSTLNYVVNELLQASEDFAYQQLYAHKIVPGALARTVSTSERDATVEDSGTETGDGQDEPDRELFYELGDIVDAVYQLESSGGKNDSCRAEGKYNGFGYRINKSEHVCYDNPRDARSLVEYWFFKETQKRTLSSALCLYNSGTPSEDCPYFQNFLKVVKQ